MGAELNFAGVFKIELRVLDMDNGSNKTGCIWITQYTKQKGKTAAHNVRVHAKQITRLFLNQLKACTITAEFSALCLSFHTEHQNFSSLFSCQVKQLELNQLTLPSAQ
jgi:hypothetical protein